LSFLDFCDPEIYQPRANRADAVGQMVRRVLDAADPDATFEMMARAYITNQGIETRRFCVTALSVAFGANRAAMKRWLRSKAIVSEND
jgi:hypothetical protein